MNMVTLPGVKHLETNSTNECINCRYYNLFY